MELLKIILGLILLIQDFNNSLKREVVGGLASNLNTHLPMCVHLNVCPKKGINTNTTCYYNIPEDLDARD